MTILGRRNFTTSLHFPLNFFHQILLSWGPLCERLSVISVPRSSSVRAIGCALLGFLLWTMGDTCIKLAGVEHGVTAGIMIISSLSGMTTIFILTALRGNLRYLRPQHGGGLVVLAALFFLAYVFALLTLPFLPMVDFYAVIFLAPILIASLAALFLHEKLTVRHMLAILAGFVGVLVAIDPTRLSGTGDWYRYAAAMGLMLCITLQMLTMRLIGKRESRECMAFYPRLGPCLGGLAILAVTDAAPLPLNVILYSLAMGGVGGLGWMLVAQAYKLAPASTVAPFQYSQIVTGAIIGYLIWGDVPSWHLVAGAAIIIASGVYILRHTQAKSPVTDALPEIAP